MNKYFIILAAAALAISASCTKVVTNDAPARKVTFAAANYVPQTKAGPVSLTNETTSFKSKGFLHAEGVTDTTQDFFGASGETISWNATAKEWAPSHDYYWPKGESSYINFVSWYDTGAGPTTATETSLEWSNRTIGTGDNIMYADEAWRFKENNNPATYTAVDGVAEGVPTLFHHALSQIQIQARATKVTNGTADWTITLKEIKVKDLYNQGTLSLTNSDPGTPTTTKAWTGDWTTSGTKGNLTPANLALTASNQTVLANQSVLPQSLSGITLDFKLEIVTTYSNVSNTEIITKSIPFYAASGEAFSSTINSWEQNKKYIYTLVVEPSENRVLFDPAVETDWETVTVPDLTI